MYFRISLYLKTRLCRTPSSTPWEMPRPSDVCLSRAITTFAPSYFYPLLSSPRTHSYIAWKHACENTLVLNLFSYRFQLPTDNWSMVLFWRKHERGVDWWLNNRVAFINTDRSLRTCFSKLNAVSVCYEQMTITGHLLLAHNCHVL